jgi:hypothetical protein
VARAGFVDEMPEYSRSCEAGGALLPLATKRP